MRGFTLLVVFGFGLASCDEIDCFTCDEMFHMASDICRQRGEAISGFVCTEDAWGCAKTSRFKCADPMTFPDL